MKQEMLFGKFHVKIPITLQISTCDSRRERRDFVSDAQEPK